MNASFSKEPHKGREYFSAGFYFALLCVLCVSVVNPVFSKEATPLAEDEVAEKRMDFMVSRYGDFVRYRPPLKGTTLLLWFGPALLLVGAIGSLFVYLRRRNKAIIDSPLSAEEQDQADSLLNIEEPPK